MDVPVLLKCLIISVFVGGGNTSGTAFPLCMCVSVLVHGVISPAEQNGERVRGRGGDGDRVCLRVRACVCVGAYSQPSSH